MHVHHVMKCLECQNVLDKTVFKQVSFQPNKSANIYTFPDSKLCALKIVCTLLSTQYYVHESKIHNTDQFHESVVAILWTPIGSINMSSVNIFHLASALSFYNIQQGLVECHTKIILFSHNKPTSMQFPHVF